MYSGPMLTKVSGDVRARGVFCCNCVLVSEMMGHFEKCYGVIHDTVYH